MATSWLAPKSPWDSWESKICPVKYQHPPYPKIIQLLDVKIAGSLSMTVRSSANFRPSFFHQSILSYKTSLRLTKLSVPWVPKMPTFPYDQPDRSRRSEGGQRSWGCSQTKAASFPMLAVQGSLAGLVSEPYVIWLCWYLQPQSLPYHQDSCIRWMLPVP